MIEIPSCKVRDLKGKPKILMRNLIRLFSRQMCNDTHLGLEATEEALTGLIDKGIAKIIYEEDEEKFYLSYYDFKTQSYVRRDK